MGYSCNGEHGEYHVYSSIKKVHGLPPFSQVSPAYLQVSNFPRISQVNAIKADPHVWTHDGDMAETYGLEPNYGCCTANFNQGEYIDLQQ